MESIVDYRNVELSRKELIVLKDVSIKISRGEFVYLIGKVGSGKSTLIKSMYCEIPIENGDATVFGYDLHSIRRKDVPMLRRKIGIVFQDFQLLTDRSVYDNLLFVLRATGWRDKREIDERIETVLKKVGMSNKSYKMPHELSGGEQQRIVIARALLNDPLLILADEPTGNLDPETGHQIISLLSSISKSGTAILMATHNISLVEEFPGRILKCEAKKIIDMGTDYLSWIEK
ncbi:MAG: ATP-binding cassette domain-containing protein [Muribaculaceae bacterium]|nr:ATP-binding cassette domain-containing protein [Muribaculaceae bacterium]